ncbi:MAG: hypothetical protein AB7P04_01195 [Bacteriovoracia bacterium]
MKSVVRLVVVVSLSLCGVASTQAGGVSSSMVAAAKQTAIYISDSPTYRRAINGLLDWPWKLADGKIVVWRKAVEDAPTTEDLRELKKLTITSIDELRLSEIGLSDPGLPDPGIYGGPYQMKLKGSEFVFLLTRDGRPWGYDHDRCFMLFKDVTAVATPGSETGVIDLTCKDASKIKEGARFIRPSGFQDLTAAGKDLLTALSNRSWARTSTIEYKPFPVEEPNNVYSVNSKEEFQFSFWGDFQYFDYRSAYRHSSQWGSIGRFVDKQVIAQIGMRTAANGATEFLVWAHHPNFQYQRANKMGFNHTIDGVWSATSREELAEIRSKSADRLFKCFQGWDCSWRKNILKNYWSLNDDIAAQYIVIQYDPARPDGLGVQFHGVDARFDTLSSTFQAE